MTPPEQLNGAQLIALERNRQIEEEGWSAEHDDRHDLEQMAWAAVCYAAPGKVYRLMIGQDKFAFEDPWPWDAQWDKRARGHAGGQPEVQTFSQMLRAKWNVRQRDLVKAGALIAAEIDRLNRMMDSEEAAYAKHLESIEASRLQRMRQEGWMHLTCNLGCGYMSWRKAAGADCPKCSGTLVAE